MQIHPEDGEVPEQEQAEAEANQADRGRVARAEEEGVPPPGGGPAEVGEVSGGAVDQSSHR